MDPTQILNPNNIWTFVVTTLTERHPLFLVWVGGVGAIVAGATQLIKKWKPTLQGNVVQAISGGVSLLTATTYAAIGGVFKDGFQGNDAEGIFFLAVAAWMAATWGYALVTDRNDPKAVKAQVEE